MRLFDRTVEILLSSWHIQINGAVNPEVNFSFAKWLIPNADCLQILGALPDPAWRPLAYCAFHEVFGKIFPCQTGHPG
jgi:hypothetical protein